jgi:hypothetical protein
VLRSHSVWNNYLCHMTELGKYKRLSDAEEALDCLQKMPVHSKLKTDFLAISRIDVQPYEKDPYLLGKRLALRENSAKKDRPSPMMLEDVDHSQSGSSRKPNQIENELDRHQVPHLAKLSRSPAIHDAKFNQIQAEKTGSLRDQRDERPSKEASPGPKTLRDLIKKPVKISKKGNKEKTDAFNLEKELANFDFDQKLLGD